MYGKGANERLIGSVLKESDNRSKVFVVTKFGFRWDEGKEGFSVDCSKEYAAKAIDASIKRLGSPPDAWAAHRIDKKVPIEGTVKAMDELRKAGKTTFIGLSECSAETLRKASEVAKIDFIETNGVLATAAHLGIVALAYSPPGRGFLTGRYQKPEDLVSSSDWRSSLPRLQKDVWDHNYQLFLEFQRLAKKKGCTPGQLALPWLLHQGQGNIVPIPGTRSEKYLIENFAARKIQLSQEELKELREVIDANQPKGSRYQSDGMGLLDQ